MTIVACVASRGHPRPCRETVMHTLGMAALADTRVVIALDDDDASRKDIKLPENERLIVSVASREDSLGAKYNRAAAACEGDVYVMLTDDEQITTPGWDKIIAEAAAQFTDGIGCVYFGSPPVPSSMPAGFAVTAKMAEIMGWFLCPWFPYWWHDTSLDEICHFTGRIVRVPVEMAYPYGYGKTRGLREVSYWATYFDLMRPARWAIAQRIIDHPDNADMPYRKTQLRQQVDQLANQFTMRNAVLRDPLSARTFEMNQSYDAPSDERYFRIKSASAKALADLHGLTLEENRAA